MSFVTQHRVNDKTVNNFFEKIPTDGSAGNFTTEAPGNNVVIPWSSMVVSSDGKRTTATLPFNYLLGEKQLEVYWELNDASVAPAEFLGWARILELKVARDMPTFDATTTVYYEEITSTTVVLHNIGSLAPRPFLNNDPTVIGPGANNTFLFSVPHTSLPAALQTKVTVKNQGDNIGMELLGNGDGILLRSQGGKRFLLRVDEAGTPTIQEL